MIKTYLQWYYSGVWGLQLTPGLKVGCILKEMYTIDIDPSTKDEIHYYISNSKCSISII